MAKVPFNTTIPEDVRDGIKALAVDGKSQGDVVTEAYRELVRPRANPNEEVGRWFRETWGRMDALPEEILDASDARRAQKGGGQVASAPRNGGFDPATIAGVQSGVSAVAGKFPCRCVHSGCQGSKFMAASRMANLCPECEAGGHRGDRHDCVECWSPA